jgi:NAD(P)H-hydrate epimerase
MQNGPNLWKTKLPRPKLDGNKYDRGWCVVIGGACLTGAARLASEAAARAGAGLTTLIAPGAVADVYRAALPAHIMVENESDPATQLGDKRRNTLVLGPGFGADADGVLKWLAARQIQRLVLDADGLNALAAKPEGLKYLREDDVLTPHAGESKRLFGDIGAKDAAVKARCVVVLKGEKTIITDGVRIVENDHASPYLASAGTGDVLAGIIGGLIAQGMTSFDAACAGVWIHGEAGQRLGPGLVASDIPSILPAIYSSFEEIRPQIS